MIGTLKKYSHYIILLAFFTVLTGCNKEKNRFLKNTSVYIPDKNLAIESVINSPDFETSNMQFHDFGYFHSDVWLKFPIHIQEEDSYTLQFYQHFIEELQLFIVKNNAVVFKSNPTGTKYYKQGNYSQVNNINVPNFKFKLPVDHYTGYLKIHSPYSPIRGGVHYWSQKNHKAPYQYFTQKQGFWNAVFGFTVFAAFMATLFFFFTKEVVYFLFAIYLLVAVGNMYITRGFTEGLYEYFWFVNYDLRGYLNMIYFVITLFYFYYLIPKEYRAKWTSVVMKFTGPYILAFTIYGIIAPTNINNWHIIIVSLKPAMLVTLITGFFHLFLAHKKGYKMAKIYVLAYSLLFVTIFLHILQITKIIQWNVDVAIFIWELSLFTELLIFTFAFAYQYHKNLQEKLSLSEQINQNQKMYLERYFSAQENQRKSIAKNLHDNVIQQLVSLRFGIVKKSGEEKAEFKNLVDSAIEELRDLSHQIMPKSLVRLGLEKAIEDLLQSSLKYTDIKYEYDYYHINERLPESIELNLYRCIQELLQNGVKHSKANAIDVQLFKIDDDLMLVFQDNGVGFNIDTIKKGLGLQSIENRVEGMNGILKIEKALPTGTLYTIKIPLT